MTVDMWGEARFFALSVLFGVLMGVIYSLVRTARGAALGECALAFGRLAPLSLAFSPRSPRRGIGQTVTILTDLALWLFGGVAYSLFLYIYHSGLFRFYSLLGVALGFGVYYLSADRAVRTALLWVLGLVRAGMCYLLWPLWMLWRLARRMARRVRRTLPPYTLEQVGNPLRPTAFGLIPFLLGQCYLCLSRVRARKRRRRALRALSRAIERDGPR